MDCRKFIKEQSDELRRDVGDSIAINALSGGVDSSVCTALGHRALGNRLKTFFIDNGLMRKGESQYVVRTFKKLGITVKLVDARKEFLGALKRVTDPEEKRKVITHTFYKKVFGKIVRESGAKFLIHGTILTDIEETVAGIKRQHNILSQLGIDPQKAYGYKVLEPLKTLRKDDVRKLAKALRLPAELTKRIPFPGPALATRIIGEVTEARLATIREATAIIEEELKGSGAFQYLAALLNDRATGIRKGRREYGQIVAIRSVESIDAREAMVTRVPWSKLEKISKRITSMPGVSRCLYDLTPKPPATVEYL